MKNGNVVIKCLTAEAAVAEVIRKRIINAELAGGEWIPPEDLGAE